MSPSLWSFFVVAELSCHADIFHPQMLVSVLWKQTQMDSLWGFLTMSGHVNQIYMISITLLKHTEMETSGQMLRNPNIAPYS